MLGGRGGGVSPLRHSCKLVHSLCADARLKIAFSTHASSRLKQIGCGLLADQLNILLVANS